MEQFIDTNIFLRYLTHDDAQKHQACLALFQQAEANTVSLITTEAIIAEVVYVLTSPKHYSAPRTQIQRALARLLILPGLKLPYRQTYLRALDLFVKYTLDFEDCLSIAHMERQKLTEVYSYDRDFDQIQTLRRLEP